MNYLNIVYTNVSLEENIEILKDYLFYIFIYERLANKKLSVLLNIPIPLVVAIKKEFFKLGILMQKSGIILTEKGREYVENNLGFKDLDKELVRKILENDYEFKKLFEEEIRVLNDIFSKKPKSDLSIDQTECTPETSLKRAVTALKYISVIEKNILCIGDDDLVSLSIIILLKKIYKETNRMGTKVSILEIDKRMIDFIENSIKEYSLFNIECIHHDLLEPLPEEELNKYDTVFTDPPYTLNGLKLFLSRGKSAMHNNSNGKLFLSFGEKSAGFNFLMQNLFLELRFLIEGIYNDFNEYKGAGIIGNRSNMIVLSSLQYEDPEKLNIEYTEELYTGKINKKLKKYKCKICNSIFILGEGEKYRFIEELKESGCPKCKNTTFNLVKIINNN